MMSTRRTPTASSGWTKVIIECTNDTPRPAETIAAAFSTSLTYRAALSEKPATSQREQMKSTISGETRRSSMMMSSPASSWMSAKARCAKGWVSYTVSCTRLPPTLRVSGCEMDEPTGRRKKPTPHLP